MAALAVVALAVVLGVVASKSGSVNTSPDSSVQAYTIPTEGYGDTLTKVKSEGLTIGFRGGTLKGFLEFAGNSSTPKSGFEFDLGNAVAAAIFGSKYNTKVDYYPGLDGATRFTALDEGKVEVVFRTVTNTATRDSQQAMANGSVDGFNFAPTYYYDGQDILVKSGVTSPSQMVITTQSVNVTTDDNIIKWAASPAGEGATVVLLPFTDPLTGKTYASGPDGQIASMLDSADYQIGTNPDGSPITVKVNATTSDSSALIGFRLGQLSGLTGLKLWLKDNNQPFLSKEPLAPMVREGDEQWNNIVRQVMNVLFEAEEEGVVKTVTDPTTQTLVYPGYKGSVGPKLGLDENWAYNIISAVGNYGEIWNRNLSDPAWAPRGPNESWKNGGLMYAPPVK